jgi:hypothetical protein
MSACKSTLMVTLMDKRCLQWALKVMILEEFVSAVKASKAINCGTLSATRIKVILIQGVTSTF